MFLMCDAAVGCVAGPQTVGQSASASASSSQEVVIQYAQWSVRSNTAVEQAVAAFNDAHSGDIRVDLLNIPLDRYQETLNMLNTSGQGPDVFELNKEWLPSYIDRGFVTNLTALLNGDPLAAYPDWAVQQAREYSPDGALYSFPTGQVTYRLLYNKDLFAQVGLDPDKPPTTLADLTADAAAVASYGQGKRIYGFALPAGEFWVDVGQLMEAVNAYSGAVIYDPNRDTYDLSVYAPWLAMIQNMNSVGIMLPGMDTMSTDLAMAQFNAGNIGIMYASSWQASMLLGESRGFDVGVAMPPLVAANSPVGQAMVTTVGWNAINSSTEHAAAALEFFKYLESGDYLTSMERQGLAISLDPSATQYGGFAQFLPSSLDRVYPGTPLPMDEWSRKDAYESALASPDQLQQILLQESDQLNTALRNSQHGS